MSMESDCFIHEDEGQGMVEYGLIVGLVAILVIAVFVAIGPEVRNMFTNSANEEKIGEGQSAISAAIYE